MKQKGPLGFFHRSNLVTYLSLLAGFFAFIVSQKSHWNLAGAFLALSVFADMLDGKFASLFYRAPKMREFGIQLDSLVDAIVFGVLPFLCLNELITPQLGLVSTLFYLGGFFNAMCAVTRLGFYNVNAADTEDFLGLPTTLMGLIWVAAFIFRPTLWVSTFILFAGGILMVAPIPIPRPGVRGFFVLVLIVSSLWLFHIIHVGAR